MLSSCFHKRTGSQRPETARQATRSFRLQLEALEKRDLLSAAPSGSLFPPALDVTADHALYRHDDATGWVKLGDNIRSYSAADDTSGFLVVFAVTVDGALIRLNESGWQQLGAPGTILSTSAARDASGQLEAFAVTTDRSLFKWSDASGWLTTPLGGAGSILSIRAEGQGQVMVVTTDHAVAEYLPQFGWAPLTGSGFARSISTVHEASGNLVVFVTTLDSALYRHDDASGWLKIGSAGTIDGSAAGTDASGNAEALVLTPALQLDRYTNQDGWSALTGAGTIDKIGALARDQFFVVTADGSFFGHDDQAGWVRLTSPGFDHPIQGNVPSTHNHPH
jgi:hypothetical protein